MLGSYKCDCLSGFEKLNDTANECSDINECDRESVSILNDCHRYAKCTNAYGGYNCTCLAGFEGNGKLCYDIDECNGLNKPDQALCYNTGKCVNTIGYYRCDCFDGFTKAENSEQCIGEYLRSIKIFGILFCTKTLNCFTPNTN